MNAMKKTKPNNCQINLQKIVRNVYVPRQSSLELWAAHALPPKHKKNEITIRVVGTKESAALNEGYRHKSGPTNILSFPFETPAGIELPLLGDLIICAPLLIKEAKQQKKLLRAHWAHLVIHGVLHLQGYDHVTLKEAKIMESLEIKILQQLGFGNPYE